jgi:hypothetical protein
MIKIRLRDYLTNALSLIKYVFNSEQVSIIKKRQIINDYAIKFSLQHLVETGTYLGQSTNFFSKRLVKVQTIELNLALFDYAKQKFKKRNNIVCHFGDSQIVLKEILDNLDEPSIFFLDGHMSGGITSGGSSPSPVKSELQLLKKFKLISNSVIFLDDARGFDGTNSYPDLVEISDWCSELNFCKPQIIEDMIVLVPTQL